MKNPEWSENKNDNQGQPRQSTGEMLEFPYTIRLLTGPF